MALKKKLISAAWSFQKCPGQGISIRTGPSEIIFLIRSSKSGRLKSSQL
jgi:hypothetical protein